MDEALRRLVRERAAYRCEYCYLPQDAAPYITFHIEHIRARQHAGDDNLLNLAVACPDCNLRKGTNLTTISPDTEKIVPLFNPRMQAWADHFEMVGAEIIGLTEIGRATVRLLDMNEDERVVLRAELLAEGLL